MEQESTVHLLYIKLVEFLVLFLSFVKDYDGQATDLALGWAIGIGAPFAFGNSKV